MSHPKHVINLPDCAISVRNLVKTYQGKSQNALDGIDLDIPRGSFFALLGPNGAGKSTFINILAGLVNKTSGQVSVWNFDLDREVRQTRLAMGIVPQELVMDPFFSPRETLELQAGFYGVGKNQRRTEQLLENVGLADKADAYARSLSGGMKRRLLVAKALVHNPPIVILDEPTAGVDIELRKQLWDYISKLNRAGTTILLTTHYLEEAQELCDQLAIINHGKIVAVGDTKKLVAQLDRKQISVTLAVGDQPILTPPEHPSWAERGVVWVGPLQLKWYYRPSVDQLGPLLAAIGAAGYEVVDIATHEANLEDLFLALTRE